jgi:hypothetical protein
MHTSAVVFESYDLNEGLASEGALLLLCDLDAQAHDEDRFIAGFLKCLGARCARVRQLAKHLAQEALDELIDAEGRIDFSAHARLDVATLFARCSTLSAHGRATPRERRLLVQAFNGYVRATGKVRSNRGRRRATAAGHRIAA